MRAAPVAFTPARDGKEKAKGEQGCKMLHCRLDPHTVQCWTDGSEHGKICFKDSANVSPRCIQA